MLITEASGKAKAGGSRGKMEGERKRELGSVVVFNIAAARLQGPRRTCSKWGTHVEITDTRSQNPHCRGREPGGTCTPLAFPQKIDQ